MNSFIIANGWIHRPASCSHSTEKFLSFFIYVVEEDYIEKFNYQIFRCMHEIHKPYNKLIHLNDINDIISRVWLDGIKIQT